jgi:hypothetical protein
VCSPPPANHPQLPPLPSPRPPTRRPAGLPGGARVFYRVGWPEYDTWSPVLNFTTFKDTNNFPFKVGVMADLGLSYNASETVTKVMSFDPAVVLNIGDLPYAGGVPKRVTGGNGVWVA